MNIIDKFDKKVEIKIEDKIKAIRNDDKVSIEFLGPHRIEIPIKDNEIKDAEIIRLLYIRDKEGRGRMCRDREDTQSLLERENDYR